jgi:surfeit locus 1 family protein
MKSRARRLLVPGLSTVLMMIVLVGLGTWQVQRLAWKRGLLDDISRAEAAPGIPLPANPAQFTKVQVTGKFRDDLLAYYGAEVRATPRGDALGSQLITPLIRADGPPILVDRGWVPTQRFRPIDLPRGEVTVEGYVRLADHGGLFSARDDPATRVFYTLDPAAIGAALGLDHVAPFTIVAMGTAPPELYPDPARQMPRPPNDHLQYAITWYFFAFTLLIIFVIYARKVLTT